MYRAVINANINLTSILVSSSHYSSVNFEISSTSRLQSHKISHTENTSLSFRQKAKLKIYRLDKFRTEMEISLGKNSLFHS